MTNENEELLERINRYSEEWDLAALDELALNFTGAEINDAVRTRLIEAYCYHYGQLAMDYAAEKYWSGGQSQHLSELLDRLSRLVSISGDPFYLIQKARFLREQAVLDTDETERQRHFEEAYAVLDTLLDNLDRSDPTTTKCRAEMVELLAEWSVFRSDRIEPLDRAADILERLLSELDQTTFETVGAAMMYVRRLPEFPACRRLVELTTAFDRWAEDRWTRKPELLITWCSLYVILLHQCHTDSLFENWYAGANRIPKVVKGAENGLSRLSHSVFSLAADLIRKGEDEAGERCYLLSLDIETVLCRTGAHKGMAWRKLHFAGFLIDFYLEHDRTPEAIDLLLEHLQFGRDMLETYGTESSLHGHMSGLLQIRLDLFEDREKADVYREITEHLTRRIEALKEQFSDFMVVADRKVWRYLYYVYDDDYENLIRCHLMLGNGDEAIRVLQEWFSLDTRKREELGHSSVDWHQIAAKQEFAPVRADLLRIVN
jgi:hypothetical protein